MIKKEFKYIIAGLTIILFLNILFIDWWILNKGTRPEKEGEIIETIVNEAEEEIGREERGPLGETCPAVCLETLKEEVGGIIATLSGETKTSEEPVEERSSQAKTVYVPLGGEGSTVNQDWTDVKAAEVYLDLSEYSGVKEVTWEAFLKVKHGNGRAFARLFNVTQQAFVFGSDISAATEDFVQERSSFFTLWPGKNLYRVQLKSLTGYEATIDSGRIKIVLE